MLALALGGLSLWVYMRGDHYSGSGDTIPNELLPLTLVREGDFDFNEFSSTNALQPYCYVLRGDRVISFYPVVPGLLNVPAYWLAQPAQANDKHRWSKWTAATVAALSVTFMMLALTRVCAGVWSAALVALIYAFGTCCWSVASQGLWQHGPSLLFLTAACALLLRPESRWVPLAGFCLGMAVWNRPTNVVFALPATVYMLIHHRNRRLMWFLVAAAVPAVLMMWYSWAHWDSVWALGQGHRPGGHHGPHHTTMTGPFWPNLAGLLASPARGLFVFSPVFLFAVPVVIRAIARAEPKPVLRYLFLGAVLHLGVFALWRVWWGGWSFGYRMLIEMLPALTLALGVAWDQSIRRRWWWQALFWPAVIVSGYIHYLGATYYPTAWNPERSVDVNRAALWDWEDTELRRLHRKCLADWRATDWD